MGDAIVHLHQHTEFSMLDGASRIGDVVAAAVRDGQPALGITDHGNMYGVLDFYAECNKQGIKPVIGIEAYQAHDSRHERPARRGRIDDSGGDVDGGRKAYYHLLLYAETNGGYRNLIQLSSRAYLEGYYMKPKLDWELLEQYSEGVIATTGCLGGHVLQSLLRGDEQGALEKAARLQDIFGRDNLFVELQDHGLPAQRQTNPKLLEIAKKIKAPLLATNDSHYVRREDHLAHDALLCVQTGSTIDDPTRFKFEGDQHYLKSAYEMRSLFSEVPTACDNTLWIAERCSVEIEFGKPKLPQFPLPPGFASDSEYLRHLTFEGAKERWGQTLRPDVVERLDFELNVIADMGFSSYFLIVGDLIRHARENNIRVGPGRGSAAGCAVAYCLRITDLDPIKYDLLFERFLNPGRKQMPDIDMDFDDRYRDEMIRYAAEKYGRDHVAQIVTFSTIKARAAVRDAARVLGYPYALGDRIAKAMPPLVMGRDTPLYACFEESEKFRDGYLAARELREIYTTDPDAKKVIDVAKGLEGLRRQDGIHAAAVVITDKPLTEYLPIQRKPEAGKDIEDAPIVTQYEMHGVEELGLLKMDFLGLRNLSVIENALDLIERTTGTRPDIDNVDLTDEPTLELLRRGDSIGVFQLEGGPMRALMKSLAPTSFDDVAALVALYRPGPMAANMHNDYADRKNGRKPVVTLHPDLEDVLGSTYQLMIYQESVMRVAQRIAGYTLEEADNLRKACLPVGTLMLTEQRGYVPIESVMRLKKPTVQTIDTRSSTLRFERVADVWSVGVKPVFRLATSTGYTIEATSNHPFLVEHEWRELGSIRPGDLVGVAGRTALCPVGVAERHQEGTTHAGIVNAPLPEVERHLARCVAIAGWADATGMHVRVDDAATLKRLLLRVGVMSTIDGSTVSVVDRRHAKQLLAAIDEHLTDVEHASIARHLDTMPADDSHGGGDLVWDTVTSIEHVGDKECFDFRMENGERPYAVAEDFLVHNCGKKIRDLIAKEREKFVDGVERNGYSRELGTQLFDIIEPFADYAFNRSHAYGYGLVSFQTAWLKANHPVEYLSALLTSVKDNQDKSAVYLNECRTMGITVQVPDVNRSASDFAPAHARAAESGEHDAERTILFGLSAVRNVGEGLVEQIITEREANGPFTDFHDFCDRVDPAVLNKRAIESLIKAGAFDSLDHERKGLLKVHELIIDRTLARRRKEAEGQFELFATIEEPSAVAEARIEIPAESFDKMERLTYEKEMLGLYVSDHPLIGVEGHLRRRCDVTIAELRDLGSGEMRVVGGVVTGLQRKYTKKGELMATFVLEDLDAACEVMVFPKTMTEHGYKLADDRVVCVKGRLDTRDDEPKIVAMDITVLEVTGDDGPPVKLQFPPHAVDETTVDRLKKLLLAHPGPSPVLVTIGTQTLRLSPAYNVDETNGLRGELLAVFGPDVLKSA